MDVTTTKPGRAALSPVAERLKAKLNDRSARIGVVGLGYVGLPLAVEFGEAGFRTLGIDLNTERVQALNAGKNYIQDVADEALARVLEEGVFRASDRFDGAAEADVVFICVPTPVNPNKDPDTSYIRSAAEALAPHLHEGQLVILKSTTYPGTTEELVLPILEEAARELGLTLGQDYFLAFSPERIDPGNTQFTTANTPVVVGGVTEACTDVASLAMGQVVAQVHRVTSPKVAEMEKLLENIFRSVNIALVNELARLCDRVGGISMWEVVEAAATKPFGYMPFYPGPGLGGHCIPIDPYYLSWMARKYDFETNFITLSARVNEEMPYYVGQQVLRAVADLPIRLSEAKVLILGAAFKKNVDDTRHSPAYPVIENMWSQGLRNIAYSDPHVPTFTVELDGKRRTLRSVALTPETLREHDVVVILTDHDAFPYADIARHAGVIIDTRNAMKDVPCDSAKVRLLGGGRH